MRLSTRNDDADEKLVDMCAVIIDVPIKGSDDFSFIANSVKIAKNI